MLRQLLVFVYHGKTDIMCQVEFLSINLFKDNLSTQELMKMFVES